MLPVLLRNLDSMLLPNLFFWDKLLLWQADFNEERANPKKCLLTRADGTEEELNFDQVHSEVYSKPERSTPRP